MKLIEKILVGTDFGAGTDALLEQALQIAKRISQTLGDLQVEDLDQRTVPIPTISQGIAVYPIEANEVYRLVDIADRRLYVATERGRNQIEPTPETQSV